MPFISNNFFCKQDQSYLALCLSIRPHIQTPKWYAFNLYNALIDAQENVMAEKQGGNLVHLHSK